MIQVGKTLSDASKAGLLDETKTEKYQASRDNNLKAIHRALMLAADSDGEFPEATKWMETALIRLKTSDISEDEAKEKLKIPGLGPTEFGYALNTVFGKAHPGEIKVKSDAILVYESKDASWNAHGNPETDGRDGGKAVTFGGEIISLPPPK